MIPCPSREQLGHFLNDQLDDPERDRIGMHVDRCAGCQEVLELLSNENGSDRWRLDLREVDRHPGPGLVAEALGRLVNAETTAIEIMPAQTGLSAPATLPGTGRGPTGPGPCLPVVEGYEVVGEIGHGGMGVVYKARQAGLNRLVALKMILENAHRHPDHLERFLIEAEAVARLRHPNVVQIFDVGSVGGLPYFSLELLEGGSLSDKLSKTPRPTRWAAELLATLALAVHAAHQAGIVHRDLKPSNILFDRDGTPKITDFGLAKRMEGGGGQTHTGEIMGSPSYMAPEQALGQTHRIGPAGDVYALGVILYEMLTGRVPFHGMTPMMILCQVAEFEPISPSRLQSGVPRDLEIICLKCLAKEPSRRYAGALELATDLRRFLDHEPIRARRTPPWERGVKWARRHRLTTALLALCLVTLLAVTWAGLRDGALRRDRLTRSRIDSDQILFDCQSLLSRRQWDDARVDLTGLLTRIRDESQLADQRNRATGLLRQADRGRAEQDAEVRGRGLYQRFLQLRKEALFHETQITGLGLSSNDEKTRQSAREALAVFATPGSKEIGTLATLPSSFSESERAEIDAGRYELLLILAERTEPAGEGLQILDRAARLHPAPTRAFYLRQAGCLARLGDAEGAGHARAEAERIQPSTALDHFLTGQERYNHGDWVTAHQDFQAAVRLQPDHFWAHCLTSVCCLQMNRPKEALSELNACLQREPDFAWLYVLRGYTASLIAARARDESAKLTSARGDALRTDEALQFQAAEADFRRAWRLLESRPEDELHYVLLVDRGLMWFQRRDMDRAADDLRQAIAINDHDFQAFAALAKVYQERGDLDGAIRCYTRAIEVHPSWAPLYRGRADVYLGRKDLTPVQRTLAMSDLEQAIKRAAPGDPVVARDHTNRARLLHGEGRDQEAVDACAAAVKIAPEYAAAHLLRLRILLELKRDDDMLKSCEALLAQGRSSAELYELRSLARTRLGDYAGAIEDVTTALGLRPDRTPLLTRRGWLYLTSRAPSLALLDFDRAIERDPANGDAHVGRGSARVRLGDHRGSVSDAEAALRLGGSRDRLFYNAARIYAQAAQVVTTEVRRNGHDAVTLANRYQDRAVALATEAMGEVPLVRRAAFWRNQILADPALQPIVRRLKPPPNATLTAVK